MSRESIVFIIGLLLLIVPSLGVPDSWKFYFFIAAGVVLIIVGYSLRRASYIRSIENEDGERSTDSFKEQKVIASQTEHAVPPETANNFEQNA